MGRSLEHGFGWIMSALLIFSGPQLVMLGLPGEYPGRMFMPSTAVRRPAQESLVRSRAAR